MLIVWKRQPNESLTTRNHFRFESFLPINSLPNCIGWQNFIFFIRPRLTTGQGGIIWPQHTAFLCTGLANGRLNGNMLLKIEFVKSIEFLIGLVIVQSTHQSCQYGSHTGPSAQLAWNGQLPNRCALKLRRSLNGSFATESRSLYINMQRTMKKSGCRKISPSQLAG